MAGAHKIVPRWGQPLTGIIALVVFTLIAWVTWYIIGDPAKGIFRLYEQPFTAFLAVMIVVGVWQHIIFGDYPFQNLGPLSRGIAMTITNIVISWFLIYVFFEWLGVILPFFSTEAVLNAKLQLIEMAGLPVPAHGTELYEELHHGAMDVKMAAVTFWVVTGFVTYPFWAIMFQKWPWAGKLSQPAAGMAEWAWTSVVTILVFGIFVVPHFANVAYPGYLKAALPTYDPVYATYAKSASELMGKASWAYPSIWYAKFAPIGAKNYLYIVSWYEWIVIVLFLAANTWQGWPWNFIKTQPLRGVVGTIGMVFLAYVFNQITLAIIAAYWGAIPLDTALDPATAKELGIRGNWGFRHYHSLSIAAATIMPFLAWHHYFDDWPNQPGMFNIGWWIRFVGVFALAGLWMFVWYKICWPMLGLWPGLATSAPSLYQMHELVGHGEPLGTAFQVMNKPAVWIFWWIIPLLFNEWFMHKWPFYVEEHEHH